jgi:octopamine receptor alpha
MPTLPSASTTQSSNVATIETHKKEQEQNNQTVQVMPIPIVTCDFASDVSTSEAAEAENQLTEIKDTLKVGAHASSTVVITNKTTNGTSTSSSCSLTTKNELQVSPTGGRCRALSVGIETDMVSEFDPSSSDSGVVSRCAVVKPLKFRLCQPIFGKKVTKTRKSETKTTNNKHELEPAIPKVIKPRDPEKEKRRIARKKEKRATLILGLIMGSFIACWLPFFFLYILVPACPNCVIPDAAFSLAFWLGYMNSALNPAIYTIFNKDFRRAFRRILFK